MVARAQEKIEQQGLQLKRESLENPSDESKSFKKKKKEKKK